MKTTDVVIIFSIFNLVGIGLMIILLDLGNFDRHEVLVTAINDHGCASHQELKPTKTRIENYNLTNL